MAQGTPAATVEALGTDARQFGPALPMWVYTYTALANGKGALYEIIAARELGGLRAEVIETIHLAALMAGLLGMNLLGEIAHGAT